MPGWRVRGSGVSRARKRDGIRVEFFFERDDFERGDFDDEDFERGDF